MQSGLSNQGAVGSWEGKPSRRLLVRNLPPTSSRDLLHSFFSRYGELREVFIPVDPTTKKQRAFGFVEFKNLADANTVYDSVKEIDGQKIQVVFVEAKREQEQALTVQPAPDRLTRMLGANTILPVAPPPPMNPNTETYRYNVNAGEFVIDSSGRLTRRRDGMEISTREEREVKGLGGGLLVAVGRQDAEIEDWNLENSELLEPKLSALKPSEVIDFRDI